jgi:GT2 family glycosyltransferase
MSDLTAVILNWNQPDYAVRSAECLIADGLPASRVVVVDNGSTDASWERFERELRGCHLVRIAENLGFARGNNLGARALRGSAYLFVNSDAFVHRPGSVRALLGALDAPGVGIVVPRLLNEDLTLQPVAVPAPRPGAALARASGLSRFVPNRFQPHWGTHWDHGRSQEIEAAAPGAVLLVRGTLWDALGGFTETSFMYAEDLDLCLRARERGSAVWFCGEAEFVHLGGGSTDWDEPSRAERSGRANGELIRAHLSPAKARLTLAVVRAGFAGRRAFRRVTGNGAAAATYEGLLRGYRAAGHGEREVSTAEPEIAVLRPDASSEEAMSA